MVEGQRLNLKSPSPYLVQLLFEFPSEKHQRRFANPGLSNLNRMAQFITQSRFNRVSH